MSGLKADVVGLAGDVRSLGGILGRIEQGVLRSQERSDERIEANKPNPTAIVSVLITIISLMVGGAWMISGQLASQHERSEWVKEQLSNQDDHIERVEGRQRTGGPAREGPSEAPQTP